MRIALLGSGKIVQELLSIVPEVPGMDVVAIQGREASRERVAALAQAHHVSRIYTDPAACLRDPDVDAVYIGLPNDLHFGAARAALLAGKDVICEKPIVPTIAEFDSLIALARERGLILVEAITTQHLAAFRALADRLPYVGRIRLVESVYTQRSSRYDAFRDGAMPSAFDSARGGGALMDLGVYTLHAIIGVLGEPESVDYRPTLERGSDTSGVVTLGYEGAQGVGICAKDADGPSRTVVHGDEGWIQMDGAPNSGGPVTVHLRGREPEHLDPTVHPHRMVEEMREFTRIIDAHDLDARDRLFAHSRTVLAALERARSRAGDRVGAWESADLRPPPRRG